MIEGHHVDLRALRILVLHPRDRDGDLLIRSLRAMRCQVDWMWPPQPGIRQQADIVFCLIDQRTRDHIEALSDHPVPAIVGIADTADPATLGLIEGCSPHAVINKPIDMTAILTNLMVARNNSRYVERLLRKIAKLEDTLRSARKIERAKEILMKQRKIEEPQAYEFLRKQAMKKRVSINVIAGAIVESSDVLSND